MTATTALIHDSDRLISDKKYRLEQLQKAFVETTEGILRCSVIVKYMDAAGDDFPKQVPVAFIDAVRRVARQELLPETFLAVNWSGSLLKTVARYSKDDQRKIANDKTIETVVRFGDSFEVRKIEPISMSTNQIKQVFGPDGLRAKAQQIAYIEDRATTDYVKTKTFKPETRLDKKRGGAWFGETFVSRAELASLLAQLV